MLISERVSSFLSSKGSKTVFMVTGGAAMFLNDSFTRNNQLKTTFFHHEQACAMAAEGYARISGRINNSFTYSGSWGNKFIKWNFWGL